MKKTNYIVGDTDQFTPADFACYIVKRGNITGLQTGFSGKLRLR